MSHKRNQIRDAIAELLGAVETLEDRVHKTRVRPTGDAELPVVIVYSLREESELANVKRALDRSGSVAIEIRVGTPDSMDDEIDDLCETVENAMESDYRFGTLATNSWLASTTIGIDGEGDLRQGVATLEYRVNYRTEPGAVGG